MDPTYPLLPIVNFLCAVLVLVPLPWLFRSWNTGSVMMSLWIFVTCFTDGVNEIIWADNVDFVAPVWCDITTRIFGAALIGVSSCSMTMTRRIFHITRLRGLVTSKRDKRNEVIVDLLICLGLPLLTRILYYIVQPNRFDIWEEVGCLPPASHTVLYIILVKIWPVLCGTIALLYTPFILWSFLNQRRSMNEFLASNSSLDHSVYYRIIIIACISACVCIPLGAVDLWINVIQGLVPWPGFAKTHEHFSIVHQIPAALWRAEHAVRSTRLWDEWLFPASAVTFFLCFGVTNDARENYRAAFWRIAGRFGCRPKPVDEEKAPSFRANPRPSLSYDETASRISANDSDGEKQSPKDFVSLPQTDGRFTRSSLELRTEQKSELPIDRDTVSSEAVIPEGRRSSERGACNV